MADGEVSSRNVEEKMADKGKEMANGEALNINFNYSLIYIKTDTSEIVSLYVKGSDTVASIKLRIQANGHIPFDQQELIFNEEVLDNKFTFSNFDIKDNSTLTVTGKPVKPMNINVYNMFTGNTISLEVYSTDTIADLKMVIFEEEDILRQKQALIFEDRVLRGRATLFDYYITNGATLTLMCQSRGFVIDIILSDERTITLKVKPSDTIRDIKVKLEGKTRYSCDEQELIFNNMVLHNKDTLYDCHISKDSKLTLMLSSSGLKHLVIRPVTGETFTLDVKCSNTIRTVKRMIQDKLGIPISRQRLTHCQRHLQDSVTLAVLDDIVTPADYCIDGEMYYQLLLKFDDQG